MSVSFVQAQFGIFSRGHTTVCSAINHCHKYAQPPLRLLVTPSPQAYPRGSTVQVCCLECFAQAARAVYGPAKGAPVDAFVVQALSWMEGLDDGTPSLWLG